MLREKSGGPLAEMAVAHRCEQRLGSVLDIWELIVSVVTARGHKFCTGFE